MPVTTSLLSPAVPFIFFELQSRDSHLLVLWLYISPFLGFWALLLWIPPRDIMLLFYILSF
jgi:hypothetical protein